MQQISLFHNFFVALSFSISFTEKQGRSYNTILGVPYIVDDVCIAVIVITMKEAGSLDYLYSECLNILQRYVQIVGLSILIQNDKEEE